MRWLRLLAPLLLVVLGACALTPGTASYLAEPAGPYHLDSGDVVKVTVYGDANLTATYKVGDSGTIALPLVGPVPVRGLTTDAAAARITAALAKGYMRNPNVAVEVDAYRPFYIQGAVKSAGQFPYVYGMTVRAAISTAGGFTATADRGSATVYRNQGDKVVKDTVNLDFPIYPGDTIVVAERWF